MNGISLRDIIFGVLQQDNRLWNKEKPNLTDGFYLIFWIILMKLCSNYFSKIKK